MTEGLGYPFFNSLIYVVCWVINVFLMIYLMQDYGNIGVAFGRMAGVGTMFFSIFYVEKWFFKRVQGGFWLKLIGTLGMTAAVSTAVQKIIIANSSINWVSFISAITAGGVCYCLALLVLGFVTDEEKLLIKNILSR